MNQDSILITGVGKQFGLHLARTFLGRGIPVIGTFLTERESLTDLKAQDNLTLSFAARLAPKIKVNSIAPALMLFNEHDDAAYRESALRKACFCARAALMNFSEPSITCSPANTPPAGYNTWAEAVI